MRRCLHCGTLMIRRFSGQGYRCASEACRKRLARAVTPKTCQQCGAVVVGPRRYCPPPAQCSVLAHRTANAAYRHKQRLEQAKLAREPYAVDLKAADIERRIAAAYARIQWERQNGLRPGAEQYALARPVDPVSSQAPDVSGLGLLGRFGE